MDAKLIGEHMRELLAEEAALLSRLETLLDRESEALRDDDFPAIDQVGAERHRCVEALLRIDGERRTACRMLGLGDDRRHFEQLLDLCDPSGRLKSRWHAGLEIAARCKDHNDRNGAIVAAKLRRVEALLMTIRGGSPTAPVYAASGARAQTARSIELARA